jgi:hypothetical protein
LCARRGSGGTKPAQDVAHLKAQWPDDFLCSKCPALMNPITRRARFCRRSYWQTGHIDAIRVSTIIKKAFAHRK